MDGAWIITAILPQISNWSSFSLFRAKFYVYSDFCFENLVCRNKRFGNIVACRFFVIKTRNSYRAHVSCFFRGTVYFLFSYNIEGAQQFSCQSKLYVVSIAAQDFQTASAFFVVSSLFQACTNTAVVFSLQNCSFNIDIAVAFQDIMPYAQTYFSRFRFSIS